MITSEPLDIHLRLTAVVRDIGPTIWEAHCPELDIYSQGEDQTEARYSLRGAVELWFDSCIERGTLKEALSEVE